MAAGAHQGVSEDGQVEAQSNPSLTLVFFVIVFPYASVTL